MTTYVCEHAECQAEGTEAMPAGERYCAEHAPPPLEGRAAVYIVTFERGDEDAEMAEHRGRTGAQQLADELQEACDASGPNGTYKVHDENHGDHMKRLPRSLRWRGCDVRAEVAALFLDAQTLVIDRIRARAIYRHRDRAEEYRRSRLATEARRRAAYAALSWEHVHGHAVGGRRR